MIRRSSVEHPLFHWFTVITLCTGGCFSVIALNAEWVHRFFGPQVLSLFGAPEVSADPLAIAALARSVHPEAAGTSPVEPLEMLAGGRGFGSGGDDGALAVSMGESYGDGMTVGQDENRVSFRPLSPGLAGAHGTDSAKTPPLSARLDTWHAGADGPNALVFAAPNSAANVVVRTYRDTVKEDIILPSLEAARTFAAPGSEASGRLDLEFRWRLETSLVPVAKGDEIRFYAAGDETDASPLSKPLPGLQVRSEGSLRYILPAPYYTTAAGRHVAEGCFWRLDGADLALSLRLETENVRGLFPLVIDPTLTIDPGTNNPPGGTRLNTATNVSMLQLSLAAGLDEPITVTGLTFAGLGSGSEPTGTANIRLYRDVNGNGQLDGPDIQIGTGTAFLADNGAVSFGGFSRVIPAGTSEQWLVLYDFAGTASPGATFDVQLTAPGNVIASGTTTTASIVGLPVGGGTVMIVGDLVVTPFSSGAALIPPGVGGVPYAYTFSVTGGLLPATFSIAGGALPSGMTLDPSGLLTGTPAIDGTYTFSVQAIDSQSTSDSDIQGVQWIVQPGVVVTTGTLPNGVVGLAYTQTVSATNGNPPYFWSVASGILPGGVTLSGTTGILSGTPAGFGVFNFTIQARDSTSPTASFGNQPLSIVIAQPLNLLPGPLPNGVVDSPYSQTLNTTGGNAPLAFALMSGTLPIGLTLSGTTGIVAGTPTASGTYNFSARASDSTPPVSAASMLAYSIVITSSLSITTVTLPPGTQSSPYSTTLFAGGGNPPRTWTALVGSLPPGLTLNPGTGQISGLPTATGTFSFTAQVADSTLGTQNTASRPFTLVIAPDLQIVSGPAPNGNVGTPYSHTFVTAGGNPALTFALQGGTLPLGLTLLSSGVVTGTPSVSGMFTFTVRVSDSSSPPDSATQTHTISIAADLFVTSTGLPNGVSGTAYMQSIGISGGNPPYSFTLSAGALPAGLILQTDTGVISGAPSVAGVFTFTVLVADGSLPAPDTASQALALTINPPLQIVTTSLPPGTVGNPYIDGIATSGGNPPILFTVTAGALPTGVAFNAGSGQISGNPSASGTFTFTVRATDSTTPTAVFTTRVLTITITASLQITTLSLTPAVVGVPYTRFVNATGGLPPLLWTVVAGMLPSGLVLNPGTGEISGTTGVAGTYNFTLEVRDGLAPPVGPAIFQRAFSLLVQPALAVNVVSLPPGVNGTFYQQTLTASGANSPYGGWSLVAGMLPPGITLNSASGLLQGIAGATGTFTFTALVRDNSNPTQAMASGTFGIFIADDLQILTTSLPAAVKGISLFLQPSAFGGNGPLQWSIVSGVLPPGVSSDPSSGTLFGTPTSTGTFTFTAGVRDSTVPLPDTASRTFTLSVLAPVLITTASLPIGVSGTAYLVNLASTGGRAPIVWFDSGTLPTGLVLNSATGQISGVPQLSGGQAVVIRAQETPPLPSTPASFDLKGMTLEIVDPLSLQLFSFPQAIQTVAYSSPILTGARTGGKSPYTWSIVAGTLPPGLALSQTTGMIQGTPGSLGVFTFTARVQDSLPAPQLFTRTYAISVIGGANPVIQTGFPSPGVSGTAYTFTFTAIGGTPAYNWYFSGGVQPPGLVLNSGTGQLSGIPTTPGLYNFSISVDDFNSFTSTVTMSLNIASPLKLLPSSSGTATLPPGVSGVIYSQMLDWSGGNGPNFTFAILSGSLPPGLTLNASTGGISGIASSTGVFTFTARVTDSTPVNAIQTYSIGIASAVTILTGTLAPGTQGVSYSQTLSASGGNPPVQWVLESGALPPGLVLSNSGALNGVPGMAGSYTFVIEAFDATTPQVSFAQRAFTVSIAAPFMILAISLPPTVQGLPYSFVLNTSGGIPSVMNWTVTAGSLPAGMALTSAGTLTGAAGVTGFFNFTVGANDSTPAPGPAFAVQPMAINVASPVAVLAATIPAGVLGTAYATQFGATGGNPPIAFALMAGSLPPGLSLTSANGTVAGIPSAPGSYNFTLRATDGTPPPGPAFGQMTFTINIAPSLVITTVALPTAVQNGVYNTSILAVGGNGPIFWSFVAGSLPPGIALNPATGLLSGTATMPGVFNFTVRASDSTPPPGPDVAVQGLSISVIPDTVPPAGITLNIVAATSAGSVQLAWTAPGDDGMSGSVALYDVRYLAGVPITGANYGTAVQATGEPVPLPAGSAENFTVTGLGTDTLYFFAIKAVDDVGNAGPLSNSPGTTTDNTPPNAVTLVIPSAQIRSTQMLVTWNAPGDNGAVGTVTTFHLRFSDSPILVATMAALVPTPPPAPAGTPQQALVTGLQPNTLYYFVSSSWDERGNKSAQANASAQTKVAAPTGLTVVSENQQVTVTWDPLPSGASGFRLYYDTDLAGPPYTGNGAFPMPPGGSPMSSPIDVGSMTSVVLTNLTNGMTYRLALRAYQGAATNEGDYSLEAVGVPQPPAATFSRDLPGGRTADAYRMLGSPVIPSDPSPETNLSDNLGDYNPMVWRMFGWNATSQLYEEVTAAPQPLIPGYGYFIITASSATIDISGSLVNGGTDFVLNLAPGWNLIGHPFNFAVNWADCKANGLPIFDPGQATLAGELWDFSGSYVNASQMQPGRAYFVRNLSGGNVVIEIPPIVALKPALFKPLVNASGELLRTTSGPPPSPPGAVGNGSSGSSAGGGSGGGGGSFSSARSSSGGGSGSGGGGGGGGGGCFALDAAMMSPTATGLLLAGFLMLGIALWSIMDRSFRF